MDVVARIVWGVKLYDPVHARDVQTPCRDIGAEKDARFCVAKFKKCVRALLLLLFALQEYRGRVRRLFVFFVVCAHT